MRLNKPLNNNYNIQFNKSPISLSHWSKSNLHTVGDIWNETLSTWENNQTIFTKLKNKRNWISEFAQIKNAIPTHWKNILTNLPPEKAPENNMIKNPQPLYISGHQIFIENVEIPIEKLKSRNLYFHNLYPRSTPTCCSAWEKNFENKIDWKHIFERVHSTIHIPKIKAFHYKCIHRAIYTECRLKKMKKSDGCCVVCKKADESTCHMFYDCENIVEFWNNLEIFIHVNLLIKLVFSRTYNPNEHDI